MAVAGAIKLLAGSIHRYSNEETGREFSLTAEIVSQESLIPTIASEEL